MRKLVVYLSILFFMASCQSKKQVVKTNTEIKTSVEQEYVKTEDAKTSTKTSKSIAESITEKENAVIEETITKLSKPDSLGNQYPEEIINRKTSSGKNSETTTDTKEEVNQASDNKIIENKNQVTDQEISNQTKEKTKVKQFIPWKIIVGVVVLAGIGLFLWFRFFKKLTNRFNLF